MSRDQLLAVLERATVDLNFRKQLASAPERALAGFTLTAEERAALGRFVAGPHASIQLDARIGKLCPLPSIPGDDEPPIL